MFPSVILGIFSFPRREEVETSSLWLQGSAAKTLKTLCADESDRLNVLLMKMFFLFNILWTTRGFKVNAEVPPDLQDGRTDGRTDVRAGGFIFVTHLYVI